MRKIIHIDMDCFYAAIEIRDNPALKGKPVAVGGHGPRSVVSTASYEARKFGVHSAMPVFKARELCPWIIIVPHRFEVYRQVSHQIRDIFHEFTPIIEPLSLDEAFLDVTNCKEYGWTISRKIRSRIQEETSLTASAGIAQNKMLAKIASDWKKPNGQYAVLPDQVEAFMRELPVRKIWGIGPKTAEKLHGLGLKTCGQLQQLSRLELGQLFGSWGDEMYDLCRGIDNRPVVVERQRKSLSNETTFDNDLRSIEEGHQAILGLFEELKKDLAAKKDIKRPIVEAFVKVKFADFSQTTCQRRCNEISAEVFHELLVEAWTRGPNAVRLLGAGVRFADPTPPGRPRQLFFKFPENSLGRRSGNTPALQQ